MSPKDMDELLFSQFQLALGEETRTRMQTQFENYEYYDGKQHRDEGGALVKASELPRPPGLEYDPTRYATNYFKSIINRKARWQMGGEHGINVPKKQIDSLIDTLQPEYEPSEAQEKSDRLAEGHEHIIYQLWSANKLRSKLLQAARDRLIADRVVCKLAFNPRTGKLKYVFRPDTEFIPIFSDDDFEELIGCHFIRQKVVTDSAGDEQEAFQKQTFTMEGEGESRQCYIEEIVYLADDLTEFERIQSKQTMGLDFMPIVIIPVNDLLAEGDGEAEVADLREQNDVLNQMNEDAIDSMKFEMFSMTAVLNAPEGTADQMQIAPGAVLEARGYQDGQSPTIQKVESNFKWNSAFKDQYQRVKGAMHEVSGLPQVVPQELNFGGLNGDALQVLFHDIISDTEEHWLTWDYALQEIHEKSIRYLQARLSEPNFAYDKQVIRQIQDYSTEINFILPLPDNRKESVELLSEEISNGLESQTGAMRRLGVDDIQAKKQEIANEQAQQIQQQEPYDALQPSGGQPTPEVKAAKEKSEGGQMIGNNGERVRVCGVCNGSGQVIDEENGAMKTCPNCRGDGLVQVRQR